MSCNMLIIEQESRDHNSDPRRWIAYVGRWTDRLQPSLDIIRRPFKAIPISRFFYRRVKFTFHSQLWLIRTGFHFVYAYQAKEGGRWSTFRFVVHLWSVSIINFCIRSKISLIRSKIYIMIYFLHSMMVAVILFLKNFETSIAMVSLS